MVTNYVRSIRQQNGAPSRRTPKSPSQRTQSSPPKHKSRDIPLSTFPQEKLLKYIHAFISHPNFSEHFFNLLKMTQNKLLLDNLMSYYTDKEKLNKMLSIINGESYISLRIVDWFATNYAKKYYTVYQLDETTRFKVYVDYKLRLKAYSKKRFDPFCRWDRITIPNDENSGIQTTIGQLNFFRWAMENKVIDYIEANYKNIENDMNSRNSTSKNKPTPSNKKTRKKREELSHSAAKSIHKEEVKITVHFQ